MTRSTQNNALSESKLKIEMVHDAVCSWCPIGYSNIKTAISRLGIDVDFHFLPFELNPGLSENGLLISHYFVHKMGWSESKLLSYQKSLVDTALKAGIFIDFNKRRYYYNTHNAHLLMHWAEIHGQQSLVNERLIQAYFTEGLDISDVAVLLGIVEQLGFDAPDVKHLFESSFIKQAVEDKINRVAALNLLSIPAFIINEETLITGSNSVDYFMEVLGDMIKQQKQETTICPI